MALLSIYIKSAKLLKTTQQNPLFKFLLLLDKHLTFDERFVFMPCPPLRLHHLYNVPTNGRTRKKTMLCSATTCLFQISLLTSNREAIEIKKVVKPLTKSCLQDSFRSLHYLLRLYKNYFTKSQRL